MALREVYSFLCGVSRFFLILVWSVLGASAVMIITCVGSEGMVKLLTYFPEAIEMASGR